MEPTTTTTTRDSSSGPNGWNVYTDIDVMARVFGLCTPSHKLAIFDFETALVHTKSGNLFPTDGKDWILSNDGIPDALRKLVDHRFVIFTNHFATVHEELYSLSSVTARIEGLVKLIGIPCVAVISMAPNKYSKPSLDLLNLFSRLFNANAPLLRTPSLVVAHKWVDAPIDVQFANAAGFTFCSIGTFCGWPSNPILKCLINKD
jgi:DNA 3'-phosphatase